jgi:hypothetical protein
MGGLGRDCPSGLSANRAVSGTAMSVCGALPHGLLKVVGGRANPSHCRHCFAVAMAPQSVGTHNQCQARSGKPDARSAMAHLARHDQGCHGIGGLFRFMLF